MCRRSVSEGVIVVMSSQASSRVGVVMARSSEKVCGDRPGRNGSLEYFLQGSEKLLVLIARTNGDSKPSGDRLTIVMPDQDLPLAQRVGDGGGPAALRWLDEQEVGG